MKPVCPYCGSGAVSARSDGVSAVRIGRKKKAVEGLRHSVCTSCAKEFHTPEQHDANIEKLRVTTLELTPVTPKEIRLIRGKLGLSQDEAQRIFGGGRNAFSKYERGVVAPSDASARLMKAAVEVPGLIQYLAASCDVAPRREWEGLIKISTDSLATRATAYEALTEVAAAFHRGTTSYTVYDVLQSSLSFDVALDFKPLISLKKKLMDLVTVGLDDYHELNLTASTLSKAHPKTATRAMGTGILQPTK